MTICVFCVNVMHITVLDFLHIFAIRNAKRVKMGSKENIPRELQQICSLSLSLYAILIVFCSFLTVCVCVYLFLLVAIQSTKINEKIVFELTHQYTMGHISLPWMLYNGHFYRQFHRWWHAAGYHNHSADEPDTVDFHVHRRYHIVQKTNHTDWPPVIANWNVD